MDRTYVANLQCIHTEGPSMMYHVGLRLFANSHDDDPGPLTLNTNMYREFSQRLTH